MGKKGFWYKLGLTIGLLLLSGLVILNLPITQRYAANYISQQITNSFGSYINLDKVQIASLNTAVIKDLVIKDKENRIILQSEEVEIAVSPLDLVQGKELAGVKKVTLTHAVVNLVENSSGRWNFQDFTEEKSSSQGPKFHGNVELKDSALNLNVQGKEIGITKLNLTGDLENYDNIALQGKMLVDNAPLQLSGRVGSPDNTSLNIEGNNLDLMKYKAFLPEHITKELTVKKGELSHYKLLITMPGDKLNLQGNLKLSDLALKYQGYELEHGEILIGFNGENLRFFARGAIDQQWVKTSGIVVDFMNNPQGDAMVLADELTYAGYKVQDLQSQLRYGDNKLYVDKLALNFAGGKVQGSGFYDLEKNSYGGTISLDKVNLTGLVPHQALGGIVTAVGVVEGKGTSWQDLNFNLSGKIAQGYYNGLNWITVDANLYKTGSTITLGALNADLGNGGGLTAHGTYADDRINGEIFGTKVDLKLVEHYLPMVNVEGAGNFYVAAQGSLNNPDLKILFNGSQGKIMGIAFDNLRFNGQVANKLLTINNASLNVKDKPIYQASGRVDLNNKNLDLTIATNAGRLEDLLHAGGFDLPLTGNFSNELRIKGPMSNPEVEGKFHLWEGGYEGILLQDIEGTFAYVDGGLILPAVAIRTPFIDGRLSGTVAKDGTLKISVNGDNFKLDRLPVEFPYEVGGTGRFQGEVTGNVNYPIFHGYVEAPALVFNGQGITNIGGEITYLDHLVQLNNFHGDLGDGAFDVNFKYNIVNQWLYGVAKVNGVDSGLVLKLANIDGDLLHGAFNGTAELSGSINNPTVHLIGEMPKGYLKNYPLQNIQLDLEYGDHILKLNKFFGQQNNGKVGAIGEVDFNKNTIQGQLSATDVDPNVFVGLAGQNFHLEGVLNGDLQVRGSLSKPDADFSLYLQGNGSQYDKGYILGNLKNNIIYVNQGVISRGKSALKTYGTIPLAAFKGSEQGKNNQMNMRMYLENTDLDLLPNFFPVVQWATGQVKGNVVLQGTVDKPKLMGSISTDNAAVKFKYLQKPFTGITGAVEFKDQQIRVDHFSAKLGKGELLFQGKMDISGKGIQNYQGQLVANKLDVNSPYYKGKLNGDISIAPMAYGDGTIPKLKVNLAFDHIVVSMPTLPETSSEPLPLMGLDINVTLGDNVRAYNPAFYDLYLIGGFNIKGTTDYPQSSGEIVAKNGTINVFKNVFKVDVGSIKFNQFASYFPTLDFKASTQVDRTKIFVSVAGPLDKELNTKLYSEPQMSEADIIRLLTFRTNPNGANQDNITGNDIFALASMGLQMSFLGEVEGALRDALHLDVLRINKDTLSEAQMEQLSAASNNVYNVEIGKLITKNIMLKYTHGFNYDLNKIGIQYNLNNNIGILGEYDKSRGYDVKVEMQWKF